MSILRREQYAHGVAYSGMTGMTPNATKESIVRLSNPAGSGINAVVTKLIIDNHQTGTSVNASFEFGRKDTALTAGFATAGVAALDQRDPTVEKCLVQVHPEDVGVYAPDPVFARLEVPVDSTEQLEFTDHPVILAPGQAVVVRSVQVSVDIDCTYYWVEVPV